MAEFNSQTPVALEIEAAIIYVVLLDPINYLLIEGAKMNKYEAMFIVKPDLTEEERKSLFGQINDVVAKNNGKVIESSVWSEKRKLFFPLKKYREGVYYLMNFSLAPLIVKEITHTYKLNENILRVLIIKIEQ